MATDPHSRSATSRAVTPRIAKARRMGLMLDSTLSSGRAARTRASSIRPVAEWLVQSVATRTSRDRHERDLPEPVDRQIRRQRGGGGLDDQQRLRGLQALHDVRKVVARGGQADLAVRHTGFDHRKAFFVDVVAALEVDQPVFGDKMRQHLRRQLQIVLGDAGEQRDGTRLKHGIQPFGRSDAGRQLDRNQQIAPRHLPRRQGVGPLGRRRRIAARVGDCVPVLGRQMPQVRDSAQDRERRGRGNIGRSPELRGQVIIEAEAATGSAELHRAARERVFRLVLLEAADRLLRVGPPVRAVGVGGSVRHGAPHRGDETSGRAGCRSRWPFCSVLCRTADNSAPQRKGIFTEVGQEIERLPPRPEAQRP